MRIRSKIFFGKLVLSTCCILIITTALAQDQSCPENINFSAGSLTHWSAFIGNFTSSSGARSITSFDTVSSSPTGTIGVTSISESGYGVAGIQISNTAQTDVFGGFQTVPNINGYQYSNSVLLGSTTVSPGSNRGLIRGVSYTINVPAGSSGTPYTMTYAYAMVLENGSHASNQQPLAKATLTTKDGIITCASPSYYLPTISSSAGNVLDVNAAAKQGFKLSPIPSPNNVGSGNQSPYRVWYKAWTEVTFDLSPYRGQQVILTFEADNCIPGGHFAYAYFALRNDCNGLEISGPTSACTNGTITYSIPSLADATYSWTYPAGWNVILDSANILQLIPGSQSGTITANEKNSCADLSATLNVVTTQPTVAGQVSGNNSVCTDNNTSTLTLNNNIGNVLNWLSSTDGINWTSIANTNASLIAKDLTATTIFKALVQNGASCSIDSSSSAVIDVSPKTKGGSLSPQILNICKGQNKGAYLTLSGYVGSILNWQSSPDSVNWNNFNPAKTDSVFSITNINTPTTFRSIVKSGVCPADTSGLAQVNMYNAVFPQATLNPADVYLCFGEKGTLKADVSIGTNYSWLNSNSLYDPSSRTITSTPYTISAQVAPSKSTSYILSLQNADCPNLWIDTFKVTVFPPLLISAGQDTFITANQPLQLFTSTSDSGGLSYIWTPSYGLNDPAIYNPISTIGTELDSITYTVTATTAFGCYGSASKKIKIFKTGPEIFVPSAFTPNYDGLNDILKPIPVGIATFNYFRIYNRWGQLVYNTSDFSKGWDGTFNGVQQASGTFVYTAEGTDYKGNKIFRKGTVVLIR
jgi:gliding motility-associated-like protein